MYQARNSEISDDKLDMLTSLLITTKKIEICGSYSQIQCFIYLNYYVNLLRDVKRKKQTSDTRLLMELSKENLLKALRFKNSLYGAAFVYLALIFYVKGQYEFIMYSCRLLTQHPVHTTSKQYIMGADLISHIADIDKNSVGVIALCRYVLSQCSNSTSDRKQFLANLARYDAVLTP